MKNVIVFKESGRYSGWPANYGIWSWGDEIVLGFVTGFHKADGQFHSRDKSRPFETMQARSMDGGETWQVAKIPAKTPGNRALSADEHMDSSLRIANVIDNDDVLPPLQESIDFTQPDFALMCARTGLNGGAKSWFYTSSDRCRSWQGPYGLPMFGQAGIAARTDYQVLSKDECLLFLTAAVCETEHGSHIFCAKTQNGGKTFDFLSWISLGFADGYSNMPASVRISDTRILVATRERRFKNESGQDAWIDVYCTNDNGRTWEYLSRAVSDTGFGANPPTLTKLRDGRICMTYGYRNKPYGIRAKISEDNGATWGENIILRSDGGSHDIGYPRTIQRADGSMVTAYYYTDTCGGACYIAATIWSIP